MRLKYYLRGLGIGIIVTAIIMGLFTEGKTVQLTDAQIMEKARELGMVDGVLAELESVNESETQETEEGSKPSEAQEAMEESSIAESEAETETAPKTGNGDQKEDENKLDPADQKEADAGIKKPDTAKDEDSAKAKDTQSHKDGSAPSDNLTQETSVVIAVYPGEGSYTVSRKLASLGLVESADIYDKYLCQNGYDKKLCAGNFEINSGASAEEIAKILTKQK